MNEATIRQWYDIFKGNKDLVEIRILDPESKRSYSGYFTDIETLLREIKPYDKCNLYFTLNVINQACYSREQHDRISTKPKSTTSDNDIVARKWCLIDIDCEESWRAQANIGTVQVIRGQDSDGEPLQSRRQRDSAQG